MRFLVMVKATEASEAGEMPTPEELAQMDVYLEALVKDGVLLDAGGLQPTSKGVRIVYDGGPPRVIDGPFTETKELVAGFSILQARSRDEIVERVMKGPFLKPGTIEIRQLFEPEDFAGIE